ncbi:Peptidase B [Tritonibacter multivorans]|uniref:Peptidase B n=1 Tax=Tritonibacter multivorans TaxID=928856 RepID=A0A0P1GX23_9RHOB|nr:leucyl aminopeptidase family protein [Tritonibacter multivorans]MDA7420278.1 leucyl aminopeptidase family protein [Tritonibacter multivorans]CUH80006.1 Peptidase B [Tritonibacter multivorans]SFB97160.1 leucyl aminopeptidase [Tritonibacter multivorans]
MPTPSFALPSDQAIAVHVVSADHCEEFLVGQPEAVRNWAQVQGFTGGWGQCLTIANTEGHIERALVGFGTAAQRKRQRFALAAAAEKLPAGTYALTDTLPEGFDLETEAFGWLMSQYRFDRYKSCTPSGAQLVAPNGIEVATVEALAAAEWLTRDLINTPAEDMGPGALQQAVETLGETHGATVKTITGEDLLTQNFPLIHTVGRAAGDGNRAPRLVEMLWGSSGPTLTLVGKGVCFDTGGLNLKPGGSMGLMKKDMGGAANVLGLASMIMTAKLPLRLRVLIPAAENAVSGPAFRPGDVLTSRKGLTVEVNNTDAEGRLVLADALALATEDKPDLLISMATLTGAARVAVGADLAPFYTDDEGDAAALSKSATEMADPVWRMPFHAPYEAQIEPSIADLDNAPSGGFAGSITAALFLRRFTDEARYMHFDIYGWCQSNQPARRKGGVGQGTRALFAALPDMLNL